MILTMINRYEVSLTFTCLSCHKKNSYATSYKTDSTDMKEVAMNHNLMPRTCDFCHKTGPIDRSDHIGVLLLEST